MGTPGYMAPEQVKGQQADARSDIFSLGCVIYEMASGHRAFRGETGVEVIANIDELEAVPINAVSGIVHGRAPLGAEARAIVNDDAIATSAGLVVTGIIYSSNDEIELQATLENAITGRVVRAFDTLRMAPASLNPALDTLSGWVYVTTMEELHPSLRFGAGDRIPDPVAFREYVYSKGFLGIPSFLPTPRKSYTSSRPMLITAWASTMLSWARLMKPSIFSDGPPLKGSRAIEDCTLMLISNPSGITPSFRRSCVRRADDSSDDSPDESWWRVGRASFIASWTHQAGMDWIPRTLASSRSKVATNPPARSRATR